MVRLKASTTAASRFAKHFYWLCWMLALLETAQVAIIIRIYALHDRIRVQARQQHAVLTTQLSSKLSVSVILPTGLIAYSVFFLWPLKVKFICNLQYIYIYLMYR